MSTTTDPSLRWSRSRPASLVAVLALVVALSATAPTNATAAPALPGAVGSVTVAPSEFTATVRWSPAAPGAVPIAEYVIEARDGAGRYAGEQVECGTCTSSEFVALAAGRPYTFTVTARDRNGVGPGRTSSPVTPTSSLCATSASCSSVDATTDLGVNRLRAQGLIHGIDRSTPRALLDPLHLQNWRVGEGEMEGDTSISTNQTLLLSDFWGSYSKSWLYPNGAPPWSNWWQYRTFVSGVVQRYKAAGRTGLTWEVQNEPDIAEHYDYMGSANAPLILEHFKVAYEAIKQVDPTAKVVGPSISRFSTTPGSQLMDLRTFLDFAAANGLRFSAISWHENGAHPDDRSYGNRPGSIVRHVQEVRTLIAQRPSLGSPEIHVNEYSPEATRRIPGWSVGYIEALERVNVDQANLACFYALDQGPGFSTCYRGVMDDLIRTDGKTHASYWVHRAYAGMQGGRRLATGATDPNIAAFATTDGASVQVLVGRSEGCSFPRAYVCPAPVGTPIPNHVVAVRVPSGSWADVVVERIANQPAASDGIVPVATLRRPVEGGVVRVPIAAFADGDAYRVRIATDDAGPADPSTTTTGLATSVPTAVSGQLVTLTATVNVIGPATSGGTVEFWNGASSLGSAPVGADRNARLTTPTLEVGSHSIVARFSGTPALAPSASPTLVQLVNKAATTLSLQQASAQSTAGQPVALRATVSSTAPGSGTPTGVVTFKDGASTIGTAPLSAGSATLTVPLSGGVHGITAIYPGDPSRGGSSGTLSVRQWYAIPWVW